MLSVKQGGIKYNFSGLWYNSTWDWTKVSQAIGKHCNHYANVRYKVKLATLVEGDLKAPFSITTTPGCRGGHYSIPWIAPFYPWSLLYNTECKARRYQVPFFEFLVWLVLGLNPGLLDHWWTLFIRPMVQLNEYKTNLNPKKILIKLINWKS